MSIHKAYILDTETTGFNDTRIIEAAWLEVNPNLNIISRFHQKYNPQKPIEFGAMATHHIMDEDLINFPPYTEFKLPPDCQYIIGHNIDYDWKAIGAPDVKRICTLALCRSLWTDVDSHSQSAMLYYLNRTKARDLLKNSHSADADVANCMRILYRIFQVIGPQSSWEDVWNISESARIPIVMPFGKHRGMAIKDIPSDYKAWLKKQPDTDPYLAVALQS